MEGSSWVQGSTVTTVPCKWECCTTENKSTNATQDATVSYALASNTSYHRSCLLNDYKEYDFINNKLNHSFQSEVLAAFFTQKILVSQVKGISNTTFRRRSFLEVYNTKTIV